MTAAKCTSNLGKHPSGDGIHNVCGALKNYKENSSGMDYVWSIVCQYFIECHSKQTLIQPKTALNLILIKCNQFIKARHANPISKYLRNLIKILNKAKPNILCTQKGFYCAQNLNFCLLKNMRNNQNLK